MLYYVRAWISMNKYGMISKSLQAQTLPIATPPKGKINLFIKIAVTFKPIMLY